MDPAQPMPRHVPPATRASDQDREEALQRLQTAFAEGRLDDAEFDQRMRAALVAKTRPDLERLSADLPDAAPRAARNAPVPAGKYAVAIKSSVRRGGRWRVSGVFNVLVFKGLGWIDLRAAELTEPVTTIRAIAFKSDLDILVAPGVRVEVDGFGVSKGWSEEEEWESSLPPDAPVVHVRGIGYKGTIEIRTRPPGGRERGRGRY